MAERAHPEDPNFKGTIFESRLRERYMFCLPYIKGKHVLDVPCGTGWGSSMLTGYASLTGLDIDQKAIKYAQSHYPGIDFKMGSMQQMPFEAASFDVVICLEGLEHVYLSEAKSFLKEVYRVLRPEGVLILTAPLLKNNRHSTNPYHLYEFSADELRNLILPVFDEILVETFEGPESPELRFVGSRRHQHLADMTAANHASLCFARAFEWLLTRQDAQGFKFSANQQQDLLSTCFAILVLEGMGQLNQFPTEIIHVWQTNIQHCQNPDSGLFVDPLLKEFPVTSLHHDLDYLSQQMTYFAIQALDALKSRPLYPLKFMRQFDNPESVITWLESLDWSNPWLESNRVMFMLAFLIFIVEVEQNPTASILYHSILDWLDHEQNLQTGLWGLQPKVSTLNAVAGAYHFIPFYEYSHRPVCNINRIIDATLSLQQSDGLFGPTVGGGACEDLDAIDILANFTKQASYRQPDIKRALIRSFWAIWNLQNDDGGFCYAKRDTTETYRFSNWAPMEIQLRQSDPWATWFRLLALATIAITYPDDVPNLGEWQFRRWPALGYHRTSTRLSQQEQRTLPLWIRPTTMKFEEEQPMPAQIPSVSFVIPCYNLGRYLHEAVESVLAQTVQDFEIVIVDDGSTDDFTKLLLDNFKRPKTRIIRQQNQGLPAARNRGIEQAQGGYICCLDADDRLRPDFLAESLPILERDPDIGFVTSHYQTFDNRQEIIAPQSCQLPDMLIQNQAMVSAIFRRTAWEKTGGYCETLTGLQDWDFWIGILESGYRAVVIPKVLFEYRIRSDSMFSNTRKPENYRLLLKAIAERHRETYEKHLTDVIAQMNYQSAELMNYVAEVEQGKAWLTAQISAKDKVIQSQQAWIAELEEAKTWLNEQRLSWQRHAEHYHTLLNTTNSLLKKLRSNPAARLARRLGWIKLDSNG